VVRVVIRTGLVLAAVLLALILYLSFADLSSYRSNIETAVTEATGREFRIAGEFEVMVFPTPSVLAEDVTLANAAWASDAPFLTAGHVSATVDLWSVFSGPVRIRELRLQDVELLLEENEDGDANWQMTQDDSPTNGDILPAVIEFAEIRTITIRQRGPAAEDRMVVLAALDLETDDQGLMVAQGNGRIDDTEFSLRSKVGPVRKINAAEEFEYSLLADLGGGEIGVEGTATIDQNRIDFDTSISPLRLIGDLLQIDGLPDAPLTIGGGVLVNQESYELLDVAASVPNANLQISGVIGMSGSAAGEFDIEFSATDLSEIYEDLPTIPLTFSATATLSPNGITAEPFAIMFGDSDLGGALEVRFDDPVSVTSKAHAKLLDLTPFAATPEIEVDGAAAAETDESVEPVSEWVFREEPLPFDFLNAASIDLELGIDVFQQGPLHLEALEMSLKLDDGKLSLTSGFDVAAGGSAKSELALSMHDDSADLELVFDIRDLRVSLVEDDKRELSQIPAIGLEVEILSSGNTARELAAGANGNVIFVQGAGKVDNAASGFFSTDIVSQLFGALNPFAEKEPFSNWECTVFALDINNGVAEITSMLAQSEKVTIVGGGNIDLNSEALNIDFNTKQRSGVGISADMFVTPFVQLAGTLAAPRIGLDTKGVLLSGGAAIMTAGASFFVKGMADRASGQTDRCAAALAIAHGQEVEVQQ
jgi:AsmA protein